MDAPRYSFVIPLYNEEETLPELHTRLVSVLERLDGPAEVIFVDDGSVDATPRLLAVLHEQDDRFKSIHFARNFGHQIAITAGTDVASGAAVIILDGDLQDPPEVALDLIGRWREGYDVVYAIRQDRTQAREPLWKRLAIRVFYRALPRLSDVELPVDAGDFRLVDRRALEAFTSLRETNRYVRGLFAWIGFRQTGVHYTRAPRHAGRTKYPYRKLVKLAADGVVSFSNAPLRVALTLGFLVAASSFVLGLVAIGLRLADVGKVPGWASIVVVVSFLSGVQLIVVGMMGLYVGRIYEEVKRRPLYVVRETRGLRAGEASYASLGAAERQT